MTDNLTPEQRSYAMSRVKGRDTGPERLLRAAFDRLGILYTTYPKDLPGKPDRLHQSKKLSRRDIYLQNSTIESSINATSVGKY